MTSQEEPRLEAAVSLALNMGVEVQLSATRVHLALERVDVREGDPVEVRVYLRSGQDLYGFLGMLPEVFSAQRSFAQQATAVRDALVAVLAERGLPQIVEPGDVTWL